MFGDIKIWMERQDVAIVTLRRGQLQGNPNVGRQGRQVWVEEEYDDDVKEEDENKDDWVPLNNHGRNRLHGGRIGRELVQNL